MTLDDSTHDDEPSNPLIEWTTITDGDHANMTLPMLALQDTIAFIMFCMNKFGPADNSDFEAEKAHLEACLKSIVLPDLPDGSSAVVEYRFDRGSHYFRDAALVPAGTKSGDALVYPAIDLTVPHLLREGDVLGTRMFRRKAFGWLGLPTEDGALTESFCARFFSDAKNFLWKRGMLFEEKRPYYPEFSTMLNRNCNKRVFPAAIARLKQRD